MKLLLFDDFKLGVMKGDSVVDLSDVSREIPHTSPQDLMNRLIEGFDGYRGRIEEIADRATGVPLSQVRVRPPLPKPYSILAMAVNYMEDGTRERMPEIDGFLKSSNSVIGDGDTVVLPDVSADIFNPEAELALVIGKQAARVKAEDAYDYVFGYVNFDDTSARGFRPDGRVSWYLGKCWDTFGPMGPWIATADEVPDPQNLQVRLWVDGVLRQDYNTSDMAHQIPEVIEWATSVVTFEPGDVISLGTNHWGLGPIQDGEVVEQEAEGLGRLTFHVRDDLKRTWVKETRRDIAAREAAEAARGGGTSS